MQFNESDSQSMHTAKDARYFRHHNIDPNDVPHRDTARPCLRGGLGCPHTYNIGQGCNRETHYIEPADALASAQARLAAAS